MKLVFGNLWSFPLDSGVWGTASDWVMIVVTIFTAAYLIKTFREQKRANDISENKDRREVLPVFSVGRTTYLNIDTRARYLQIELTKNIAYDVSIVTGNCIQDEISPDHQYINVGNTIDFNINEDVLNNMGPKDVVLGIVYSDIDGREYTQIVYFEDDEFVINWPSYGYKAPRPNMLAAFKNNFKAIFWSNKRDKTPPF